MINSSLGLNSLFLPKKSENEKSGDQLLELHAIDPDAKRSWMFNDTVTSRKLSTVFNVFSHS